MRTSARQKRKEARLKWMTQNTGNELLGAFIQRDNEKRHAENKERFMLELSMR